MSLATSVRTQPEPEVRGPRSTIAAAALRPLTRSPQKVEHYLVDPYVREGLAALAPADVLAVTFAVLKPEAVAGRRIERAVAAYTEHGLHVIGAWTFRFDRALVRELWRYQINIATDDRMRVVDWILPSSDSLLLVLKDDGSCGVGMPAASHLAAVKGSADPAKRRGGEIRSRLGGPSTLLNFMHTADEPADVVRELAAIEIATGLPVLDAVRAGTRQPDEALRALTAQLYDGCPAHDLDAASSWDRLARSRHPALAEQARRRCGDPSRDWAGLKAALGEGEPPADVLWDVISIATASIRCNEDRLQPVLETIGAKAWKAGEQPWSS